MGDHATGPDKWTGTREEQAQAPGNIIATADQLGGLPTEELEALRTSTLETLKLAMEADPTAQQEELWALLGQAEKTLFLNELGKYKDWRSYPRDEAASPFSAVEEHQMIELARVFLGEIGALKANIPSRTAAWSSPEAFAAADTAYHTERDALRSKIAYFDLSTKANFGIDDPLADRL